MLEKLNEKQLLLMEGTKEEWISNLNNLKTIDFEKIKKGIEWIYKLSNLDVPQVIIFDSPLACQFYLNIISDQVSAQVNIQVRDQVRAQVEDKVGGQVSDQVRAQVEDKVGGQVWAQVRDQVSAQVRAQVMDQVNTQVNTQIWAQVRGQVRDQVNDQVSDKVWSQVSAQVGAQVGAQVNDQVSAQVSAQIDTQVRGQVSAQVGGQVSDQVRAQVEDKVGGQVWAQVRAQVSAQVRAQVSAQVRAQVMDQVNTQVNTQIWDQVSDQVMDQVNDQVSDKVWSQVSAQVSNQTKIKYYYTNYYVGISDYSWLSFYDFFRKIGIVKNKKFDKYVELIKLGIFNIISLEKLCIISKMPKFVLFDDHNKIHSGDGYAIEFEDGYGQYYIHGIYFTDEEYKKYVVGSINPKEIIKIQNTEKKSALIKYYGFEKLLKYLNPKILDKHETVCGVHSNHNVNYVLFDTVIDLVSIRVIAVECHTTHKKVYLTVPIENGTETCMGAIAWTFDMTEEEYTQALICET